MEILLKVLAGFGVALLFSLAVFIHELGHFLAARWLGLQVDAFSIGFGPAIWKKRIDGCEYKLCWILFGGYVALPQLDPSGMEKMQGTQGDDEGDSEKEAPAPQLPDIAPWKRIIVSVAGPFGNVVLAVLLAVVIWVWPGDVTGMIGTRVGTVVESCDAWESGLRTGDKILAVNGTKVDAWYGVQVECQLSGTPDSAVFDYMRGDETGTVKLSLSTNNILGLRLLKGVYPEVKCTVDSIVADSPAERAGIQVNDIIMAVGDVPVLGAGHFFNLAAENGDKLAGLRVLRDGNTLQVDVQPEYNKEHDKFMFGIAPGEHDYKPWMMYKGVGDQLKWDCLSVVRVLKALVAPKNKGERKAVAKNVGGAVMIVRVLYNSVRSGLMESLGLLRMLCINLAILNLLPIPVLDGGHICFAMFEVITRRKPHPKVVATLVNVFAVILIGLMVFLVFRDLHNGYKEKKYIKQQRAEIEAATE